MRRNNRKEAQDRRDRKEVRGRIVTQRGREEASMTKPITPQGIFQKDLLFAISNKSAVFVDAPAGSGKTFVVMSTVSDWLKQGKIKKIVLSRPSVGMGKSLGLLPGDIKEKFEPYLAALISVLTNRYGHGYYETQLSNKNIEFVPLEYIRGRSFDNAVVIVDEFQNTTEDDAYTIMTRLGENSRMFCLGDCTQSDMRGRTTGLEWAISFIDRHNLGEFAEIVEGDSDDIVRSPFCRAVVKAREQDLGLN
jgi:phosphate starvation-inducible protein PhoH and related proteins